MEFNKEGKRKYDRGCKKICNLMYIQYIIEKCYSTGTGKALVFVKVVEFDGNESLSRLMFMTMIVTCLCTSLRNERTCHECK